MRFAYSLLLVLAAGTLAGAQSAPHEWRPEVLITLPRFHGYGVVLRLEQLLEGTDLYPNERSQGLAISTPRFGYVRGGLDARQVLTPTYLEHRYIPAVYSDIPLGRGFEMRSRTRVEFRSIQRVWSRRYQDRTAIGRDISVFGTPAFTYGQIDLSYDSRFGTINRITPAVGMRVPLWTDASLDTFFGRQEDSRRDPRVRYATTSILRVQL